MRKALWLAVIFAAAAIESGAQEKVHLKFKDEIASLRPSQLTAAVAAPDLKLRIQPNLQAEILLGLKKGESVTLNYRTFAEQDIAGKRSYWFYVTTKAGRRGWTFGHFLDFAKSQAETVPIVYDTELFVRPRGQAKTIDPERKPLPLLNGRGLVIKDAALFKDADGRAATGYLPALAEIEYFPFFLTDLNSQGLVRIKVKATGAEGFIDLKSGIDFPIALGMPDLENGDLVQAYSKPDTSAITKELISFAGAPGQPTAVDSARDSSGALWLQVHEYGGSRNLWLPAAHLRYDWDSTIAERVLSHFIEKRPLETAEEAIAVFGRPLGWYIQKVAVWGSENPAWLHHFFYNGLYLLLLGDENLEQGSKLVELFLWDRVTLLNFGLELDLPRSMLQAVLPDPGKVTIEGWPWNESGWITLHYSNEKRLKAIQFTENIETHWYLKAVHLDGFHEDRLPLTFEYSDEDKQRTYEIHFCE